MKKVYTLAVAMVVTGMAYANTVDRAYVKDLAVDAKMAVTEDVNLGTPAKKVNTKSTRADEWKSLGMGSFRNSFCGNLWPKIFDSYEVIPCEIEQNVGDPTQYRIKDMYKEMDFTGLEEVFHYEPGDNYVYINTYVTKDGKTIWWIPGAADDNNTGFYSDAQVFQNVTAPSAGFMQVQWLYYKTLEQEDTEKVYEVLPTIFGTVENGVFSVAAKPAGVTSSDGDPIDYIMFGRFSNQPTNYGFYANSDGSFAFTLPGVEMPTPPNPFEGKTLVGKCDMFNSIMDNLFEEYTAKVGEVEVYEGEEKGDFHIKNAWLLGKWNSPEQAEETDFAIDLTDPNFGIIDWQTTNYFDDIEQSIVQIMSKTAGFMWYVAEGKMTKEQLQAMQGFEEINVTLDKTNKKINIPAQSIWYILPDVPETSEYYNMLFSADGNPKDSYIQLPADYVVPAAISEIASDEFDGPTRYFNLQGIEIDTPAKGELVIKKNGSKSAKVIF